MKKIRIGIITFWDSSDNYGQLLQCFALQEFLRKCGYAPFLIRFKPIVAKKSGLKITNFLKYIVHFKKYFDYFIKLYNDRKYSKIDNSSRDFEKFRTDYLTMSASIYNQYDIKHNPPEADAYICGSDQIWGSSEETYYLSFIDSSKVKIAYAPSLGGTNPFNAIDEERLRQLLSEFKYIGMREKSGMELLCSYSIPNVTQVADPTFLLGKECYENIIGRTQDFNSDCFIYLLGSKTKYSTKNIITNLQRSGLTWKYVASQGKVDKYDKVLMSIPEWLNSIKNSKIIITNSFHCIVFSLIFKRPFLFVPLSGECARMNDRVYHLLSQVQLSSRIYNGSIEDIPDSLPCEAFDQIREQFGL